jgi:hypothetical protein
MLGFGESINSLHIVVDIPPCKDKAETRDLITDHYSKFLIKKLLNSGKVIPESAASLTFRIVSGRVLFPGLDL